MSARGILPTYQRFVNGMPVPFSRRSFRPREKYVIFLVFVTFGLVCFGTFFFLPEFRTGGTAESVYKVYDQIKRAAPELLIPPPPHLEDSRESPKLIRHEEDFRVDPHVIGDREKLKAKIDQDGELKVLERPDMGFQRTSSTARQPIVANQVDENVGAEDLGGPEIVTVPPAPSDHFPLTIGGEDKDSTARERRDKVKELVCGDLRGISQATVCRIIRKISIHFAELLGEYIKFPQNMDQQRANIVLFFNIAGFPSVAGCVDGTHIPIASPGGNNAEVYRNRKGYFSLNVQVIAGPRREILDIVVRHPGSTHDSVIFDRSSARVRFELREIQGLLLGDNGYPSRPYLMTPLLNPNTNSEVRYNNAHKSTRNIVERVFGSWKKIFSCIHFPLRTKIDTSLAVICATAVLYNLCIRYRLNVEDEIEAVQDEDIPVVNYNDGNAIGVAFRRAFIITHF